MEDEEIIKRRIKRLKRIHPGIDEKQLERELIPLSDEEAKIRLKRKKLI